MFQENVSYNKQLSGNIFLGFGWFLDAAEDFFFFFLKLLLLSVSCACTKHVVSLMERRLFDATLRSIIKFIKSHDVEHVGNKSKRLQR